MKEKDLIIGPFETKTRIGLIGFDTGSLYLISLDFSSTIKYSISVQLPFFGQYFDKLKNQPLDRLIQRYSTEKIKYTDLTEISVKRSNWKNYVIVRFENKTVKWNILEPHDTDNYENLISKMTENATKK